MSEQDDFTLGSAEYISQRAKAWAMAEVYRIADERGLPWPNADKTRFGVQVIKGRPWPYQVTITCLLPDVEDKERVTTFRRLAAGLEEAGFQTFIHNRLSRDDTTYLEVTWFITAERRVAWLTEQAAPVLKTAS